MAYNSKLMTWFDRMRNFANGVPAPGANLLNPLNFLFLPSLAASAIKGIVDTIQIGRANRYNSPQKMLERNRAAGLPQAYMYGGRVNQQSAVPTLSLDPTLGAATAKSLQLNERRTEVSEDQLKIALEKLGIDWKQLAINARNADTNRFGVETGRLNYGLGVSKLGLDMANFDLRQKLTDAQISNLAQENRRMKALADVEGIKAKWAGSLGDTGVTNQEEVMNLAKATQAADLFIKQNQGRIQKVTADLEEDLYKAGVSYQERAMAVQKTSAEIAKIFAETGLVGQTYKIREIEELVNQTMLKGLEKGGDATTLIYWGVMQLLSKI